MSRAFRDMGFLLRRHPYRSRHFDQSIQFFRHTRSSLNRPKPSLKFEDDHSGRQDFQFETQAQKRLRPGEVRVIHTRKAQVRSRLARYGKVSSTSASSIEGPWMRLIRPLTISEAPSWSRFNWGYSLSETLHVIFGTILSPSRR
jgi:hypothetical protein